MEYNKISIGARMKPKFGVSLFEQVFWRPRSYCHTKLNDNRSHFPTLHYVSGSNIVTNANNFDYLVHWWSWRLMVATVGLCPCKWRKFCASHLKHY